MATIIAWVVKFFSGFAIWKGQQLGKVLWVAVISLLVIFGFWKVFLEKKISKVERYYNCNVTQNAPVICPKEPTFELLKIWKLRLFSIK
jgi:hypothetical protein